MYTFEDFIELVFSTEDKDLLTDFLVGVTTSNERKELAMRVDIVQRLLVQQPHQKIAKDLGVGVATVTRGSKELAQGRFKILRKDMQ